MQRLQRSSWPFSDRSAARNQGLSLGSSEEKYRQIFATVRDAVLVFDAATRRFTEVNDAALQMYGYTRQELLQLSAMDLTAQPEASNESILRIVAGKLSPVPLRYHRKKDGTAFPVEICASTFILQGRQFYCGVVRDITERRRAERLLQNANLTLAVIRNCHQVMLRASNEADLLWDICQIIVKTGGQLAAWIGLAERNAGKSVRVAAATGGEDYLAKARITWADKPRGRGPTGTAIRTGRVCLCRNTQTDPNFAPWREVARACGYGSVIALPLRVEAECIGALCIYAAEPDAFDESEQLLLTDLANDLAFGISALRLRGERKRLEDEIVKSVEREQERIGRDLHDGLCQMLVGAKFRAGSLQRFSKFPVVKQEAKALEEMLNQAIKQSRELARSLDPVKITQTNLATALQRLAQNVEGAQGTHCRCHFPERVRISNHEAALHLYRIAQEAVQNALKHAQAKNISITLASRHGRLLLTVTDDGRGIVLARAKSGMGLNNMQTRARLIGGRLEILRCQQGGTTVSCELVQPPNKRP